MPSCLTSTVLDRTFPLPGTVTIWRLLVHIDAPALDEVVCVWIRAYPERINAAALDHAAGVVVAQVSVDVTANEILLFSTLLDQIPDLEGIREHAHQGVHSRGRSSPPRHTE